MQSALPLACFLSMIRPPGVMFENSLLQIAPVDKAKCPFMRDHNDLEFRLYTRHNPSVYQELVIDDDEKLFASHIDYHAPTVIFFHAFMENAEEGSAARIREAYILRGDTNIIMVDASRLEAGPWYFTAAENTWFIGRFAAKFIDYLVSRGLDLSRTHLIGHSLGAQAAGVAGSAIKSGRVSRITGLDPALPLFAHLPLEQRLDRDDAHFVDVIHTDSGIFGVNKPIGHADFYPNGGISPQPGCELEVVIPQQLLLNKCDKNNTEKLGFYDFHLTPNMKSTLQERNMQNIPTTILTKEMDVNRKDKYEIKRGLFPQKSRNQEDTKYVAKDFENYDQIMIESTLHHVIQYPVIMNNNTQSPIETLPGNIRENFHTDSTTRTDYKQITTYDHKTEISAKSKVAQILRNHTEVRTLQKGKDIEQTRLENERNILPQKNVTGYNIPQRQSVLGRNVKYQVNQRKTDNEPDLHPNQQQRFTQQDNNLKHQETANKQNVLFYPRQTVKTQEISSQGSDRQIVDTQNERFRHKEIVNGPILPLDQQQPVPEQDLHFKHQITVNEQNLFNQRQITNVHEIRLHENKKGTVNGPDSHPIQQHHVTELDDYFKHQDTVNGHNVLHKQQTADQHNVHPRKGAHQQNAPDLHPNQQPPFTELDQYFKHQEPVNTQNVLNQQKTTNQHNVHPRKGAHQQNAPDLHPNQQPPFTEPDQYFKHQEPVNTQNVLNQLQTTNQHNIHSRKGASQQNIPDNVYTQTSRDKQLVKRQKRFLNPFKSSEAEQQDNLLFRMLEFLFKHRRSIPVYSVMKEINTFVKSGHGELNHVSKERNNYIGAPPPLVPVTYSLELGNEGKAMAFFKKLLGLAPKGDRLTISGTRK